MNFDPNYTTTVDWTAGWKLPSAGDNPQVGFNQNTSEMGHLYYESLLKPWNGPLGDTSPFSDLMGEIYWTDTESSASTYGDDWFFYFGNVFHNHTGKVGNCLALAVHSREVSPVPIPGAVWLLGSGLIGLVGFRRKFKKW